jgi:hypothetical protein
MPLTIYWPKNGHQWCQCTMCTTEVVNNMNRNPISVERDMKYHSQNYYLKPNPVPLHIHDLISTQKAFGLFPSTQTQNNLEWTLFRRNRLPPSSECLLKTQTIIYSETLLPRSRYPNLHHIMFTHHCEKLKQRT